MRRMQLSCGGASDCNAFFWHQSLRLTGSEFSIHGLRFWPEDSGANIIHFPPSLNCRLTSDVSGGRLSLPWPKSHWLVGASSSLGHKSTILNCG